MPKITVLAAAIVLLALGGCGDSKSSVRMGEERVVFTGTVEKVEPLGGSEATVYPIGVDPLFLLVVKVNSVETNRSSPIASDKSISFAIHSPVKLFAVEDPTGSEFRFEATWVFGPEPDKHFSWIEARPASSVAR
jgi:hypothetical protein